MAVTSRPHWSYSALAQYLRCPLQYYFERVARLPRGPVSSNLILGSAVHYALAEHHEKLRRGTRISDAQVRIAFFEEWNRRTADEVIDYGKNEPNQLIEQGLELVSLLRAKEVPGEIVAVEQPLIVPILDSNGEYLEHPLVSVIDLIIRVDGNLRLVEFKTAARSYNEADVANSMQATCYVYACHQTRGEMPEVEFAVMVKTKMPKLQRLTTSRTDHDLRRLGDIIKQVQRAVDAEMFYPCESPQNCSDCSYRKPCASWSASSSNEGFTESPLLQLNPSLNGCATC